MSHIAFTSMQDNNCVFFGFSLLDTDSVAFVRRVVIRIRVEFCTNLVITSFLIFQARRPEYICESGYSLGKSTIGHFFLKHLYRRLIAVSRIFGRSMPIIMIFPGLLVHKPTFAHCVLAQLPYKQNDLCSTATDKSVPAGMRFCPPFPHSHTMVDYSLQSPLHASKQGVLPEACDGREPIQIHVSEKRLVS